MLNCVKWRLCSRKWGRRPVGSRHEPPSVLTRSFPKPHRSYIYRHLFKLFSHLAPIIISHPTQDFSSIGNSKFFFFRFRETQMNSMFSSFDALSAEFLGQAVGSNFASTARSARRRASSDDRAADGATKSREAKPPPPAASGGRSAPRFAPELDGLNCFETLISC